MAIKLITPSSSRRYADIALERARRINVNDILDETNRLADRANKLSRAVIGIPIIKKLSLDITASEERLRNIDKAVAQLESKKREIPPGTEGEARRLAVGEQEAELSQKRATAEEELVEERQLKDKLEKLPVARYRELELARDIVQGQIDVIDKKLRKLRDQTNTHAALVSLSRKLDSAHKELISTGMAQLPVTLGDIETDILDSLERTHPIPKRLPETPPVPPREAPIPVTVVIPERPTPPKPRFDLPVPGCACRLFPAEELVFMDSEVRRANPPVVRRLPRDRYALIYDDYSLGRSRFISRGLSLIRPEEKNEIGIFVTNNRAGSDASELNGSDALQIIAHKYSCFCKGAQREYTGKKGENRLTRDVRCYSYGEPLTYIDLLMQTGEEGYRAGERQYLPLISVYNLARFPYELIAKYGKGISRQEIKEKGADWYYSQIRSKIGDEEKSQWRVMKQCLVAWERITAIIADSIPQCKLDLTDTALDYEKGRDPADIKEREEKFLKNQEE